MLRLIEEFEGEGAFEPEEVEVLVKAFDAAWSSLAKSGARLDSDYRIDEARNIIGKFIINEAKKGERNSRTLTEGALLHYTQQILKKAPSKK